MRNNIFFAVLASFAVLLSGCSDHGDAKSVSYYKEHMDEAEQKQAQCQEDQVDFQKNEDCRNAADAIMNGGDFTPSPHKEW
ncbi:EexN family lipoprotein [Carnimonas bestiolae]|uniref:EexN family lipoprotein n=1 Tax=Carnimonas bestiolae TaxID=3402172 RepID=UPI003EDC2E59